jgi:hypothetical protein
MFQKSAIGGFLLLTATFGLPSSKLAVAQVVPENSSLFQWQTNEVQFSYGSGFKTAFAPGTPTQNVYIFTLQHADGWKYGDNFFFVDLSNSQRTAAERHGATASPLVNAAAGRGA